MSSPAAPLPWRVEAVRAGDPDEIDRWYRAEHGRVWKLCLGFLADRAAAEETARDAMLHLYDRLDRWDPTTPWEGWRNTVVLNLCRDRERRRASRTRAEGSAAAFAAQRTQSAGDPAAAAQRAELPGVLATALAALPAREREAFVLRELEGRPGGEVAQALGIEEASVRTLLTLARRRLRTLLAPRLGLSPSGDER